MTFLQLSIGLIDHVTIYVNAIFGSGEGCRGRGGRYGKVH